MLICRLELDPDMIFLPHVHQANQIVELCHRDSKKRVKVSEDTLHRHQHDKHLDSNDCHSQEPCNIIVEG